MQKVTGICLPKLNKVYFYKYNNNYNKGDKVVVDSSETLVVATVDFACKEVEDSCIITPLKEIIRKATEADLKKSEENAKKAIDAIKITQKHVRSLKLDMKVVDVTYSLDDSKVLIEFTAEDRVDFRDLLKLLANSLKTRIELKQIGQRDEVKIKGGIGPCGEMCCCKRFLKDFEHVTIKMAKNQGLSLSPTKISGLCGRLMCCLGYENPVYEEVIKSMPKINSKVITPVGEGVVVYNDILGKNVSVKISKGDDFEIVTYPVQEISQNKEKNDGIQNKPKKVH